MKTIRGASTVVPRFVRRRMVAMVASAAGLTALAVGATYAEAPTTPIAFPANYNWPLSAGDLQKKIQSRDMHYLRYHSWYLWAGVNQPGKDGWPIWASWNIATQVFAPPNTHAAPTEIEAVADTDTTVAATRSVRSLAVINAHHVAPHAPINLHAPFYAIPGPIQEKYGALLAKLQITTSAAFPDGDRFQNNGDILLVSEPYNQPAFDWIRGTQLYERATLTALLKAGKKDTPAMPHTSIVLKHMYWPVTKDGLTALPIVDMANYEVSADPVTTYIGFEHKPRWPRAVAIDPSGSRVGQTASVTYLYDVLKYEAPNQPPEPLGPHTYRDAKIVSLSDFYYKKLSLAEFKAMSVYDQLLIDASFYWAHGRLFQDGDFLVSIASHIITKETPEWTLQTFWWQDDPDTGRYAEDRPSISGAKGPWRHYLLNTEDGVPDAASGLGSKTLPIVYNPYIEPAAAHPVKTNCRNCHIRAGTPNMAYLQKDGPPGPLAVVGLDDKIFNGNLRTDFLWTISDRAIPVPPQK